MIVNKNQAVAILYDELLPSTSIMDSAKSSCYALEDHFSFSSKKAIQLRPRVFQLPSQEDQWSCGHRVILTLHHVFMSQYQAS